LSINFQEAIKENSVTMNKVRLLKNRMESQKSLKVLIIYQLNNVPNLNYM